jgi:SAM-dependent methyltransferase
VIGAEIIWGLLAFIQLGDAVRNRRRLDALATLTAADAPVDADLRFVCAPGVSLSEATRRAAGAHMTRHGLQALDLVPGQASLATAWSLGCHIDSSASRRDGWTPGATGAHAFVASAAVWSGLGGGRAPEDTGTFVAMAREVKRRVKGAHDLAIAPDLVAKRPNPFFEAEVERAQFGGGIGPVSLGMPIMWLLVLLGLFAAPVMGWVVFALLHLQQPLGLVNGPIRVRRWWLWAPLRIPVDFQSWAHLIRGRFGVSAMDDSDRETYQALIADGVESFFSPAVDQCPLCDGPDLRPFLALPDLHLGKPGRFRLSRCADCDHIFQNPQLNDRGLNYYYRDAYDGRNAVGMDLLFGSYVQPYRDRIEMARRLTTPTRWLDVGCGHGHLCVHGREMLPETRFEGLDMGESVEIAAARGWIDEAHRGLLVDLAPDLRDTFDVVSMSHYLEHTVAPRAELDAAHRVLVPSGLLVIELPDPDSPWARWLGPYWMPWFQPQHLHLLSTVNLAHLLRTHGFEPLHWETGRAHQSTDLFLAAVVFIRRWAPPLSVPWRPRPSWLARMRNALVWGPGLGLVLLAVIGDRVLTPFGRRLHHSSAFRVVARRCDQRNIAKMPSP